MRRDCGRQFESHKNKRCSAAGQRSCRPLDAASRTQDVKYQQAIYWKWLKYPTEAAARSYYLYVVDISAMSSSSVKLSSSLQAESLLFFPPGTLISADGSISAPTDKQEMPQEISHLTLSVGDTAALTVAARLTDGRLIALNEADAPGRLRLYSDDYSVWAGSIKPFVLMARQAVPRPAVITAECDSGVRHWGRSIRLAAKLEVSVIPGQRFIVFSERSLPGVPLALWRFGRRQLRSYRRRDSYQYIISGSGLEMPARQQLQIGWAGCVNLAAGWQPLPTGEPESSHPNCIVCEEPNEKGIFSISCAESRRRPAHIDVKTGNGETHRLQIKITPAAKGPVWDGLEESPRFKTRSRMRWEKAGRTACLTLCSLVALIWLAGCCMAQIQARGVWPGIGYTLYMLGLGLGTVLGLTVIAVLISAITFTVLRKFK